MSNLTAAELGVAYAVRALCHEMAEERQLSDESIGLAKSYLSQLTRGQWSGELVKRVTDILSGVPFLTPPLRAIYAELQAHPPIAYQVEAFRKVEQVGVATIHAFTRDEALGRAKAPFTSYEWTTKGVIGEPQYSPPFVPKESP